MRSKDLNCWWTKETADVAGAVFAAADVMEADQMDRVNKLVFHAGLYDNRSYSGLSYDSYWKTTSPARVGDPLAGTDIRNMTYNVTKSIIDTLVSRITKHKPRPVFLTSGGSWSEQRRAKKLTKFVEGQFNSLGVYEMARQAFRDACVWGTGIVKIYREGKQIKALRVVPDEILVPLEEARLGEPRQLHHRTRLHCETLAAIFPRKRSLILEAAQAGKEQGWAPTTSTTTNTGAGMVEVIESWHLPSEEGGDDGRHTISIRGACLLDEEWKANRFPFAFIHYDAPMIGFWGTGIVESLKELQATLNEMVVLRATIIRNTAVPAFLVKKESNINIQDITDNRLFKVIKVKSMEDIKPVTFGVMPNEIVSQMEELFNKAYRISGVSEMSAQSKKPSGLDSGVALREFDDIESDRFAVVQQQFEEFAMDAARHLIRLAREAKEEGEDIEVKKSGKKFFESIKWSDVDLDDSKYDMTLFSTAHLPRTPAARLQQLSELFDMGIIDRQEFLRQLDVQDLEQFKDLNNAGLDEIYETIEHFLEGGEYDPPEEFQELRKGIKVFQLTYLQNRRQAPDDVLDKLRTWISDASAILDAQEAAMAPPPEEPMEPPPPEMGAPEDILAPPGAMA